MPSLNLLKPTPKALFHEAAIGEVWNYAAPLEPLAQDSLSLDGVMAELKSARQVIEKQEEQIRKLENMALTDDLTGLLNRRGFTMALERELSVARRDLQSCGVLVMMDLDGFKSINDLWGHTVGDDYLQAVALALLGSVRASDFVARLGGDEFAILFPRMNEESGLKRLAKLEKSFNERVVMLNRRALPLRASFGLAAYTGSDNQEALFTAADLKLYAHKARRRLVVSK